MLEQKLLKLCLDNEFYTQNKSRIKDTFFSSQNKLVFSAIQAWHDKFGRSATIDELKSFIYVRFPVANQALKSSLLDIANKLGEEQEVGHDIGAEVIGALYRADKAREIGELASDIIAGHSTDFNRINDIIAEYGDRRNHSEFASVSNEITDILAGVEANVRWRFNIDSLSSRVGGVGPGIFSLVFARPEMGKTAFLTSIAAAPSGFAEQGALVHYFQNEEPAIRTMGRSATAYCGQTIDWIRENIVEARERFDIIKPKLKLFDCVGTSIEELDDHVRSHKPDVLIIDQLDKIRVGGEYAREDMRIRELYIRTRELAKRNNIAVIGASQCSAEGEGHAVLNFSWCENSKTGKAAECDLIIGIGRNPNFDESIRHLTLCKNKISGNHDNWSVLLEREKSIYRD